MSLLRDLRYSMRVLRRSPGFTFTAVSVLALAMGANTAIFSVIEAVLLRPLPYRDAERLCVLWKTAPKRNLEWDWTSYPAIRDWRERNHVFEDVAIVLRPEGSVVTLATEQGPERIQASKVSGSLFELLGVAPLIGRVFTREESERGDNAVILSHGFWQRRFGGRTDILGQTLRLVDRNVVVIGVMPSSFQFPDNKAQMWMLVTADSRWPAFQRVRFADAFSALARLRRGVSVEQAGAEMDAISARLAQQYPTTDVNLGVRVVPLFRQVAGAQVRRALAVLGGAVFCVLLIACSNVASLLVARGAARRREFAVRAALGAGRWRLIWQLASENILLSLAGGLGGLLLAYAGLHAVVAIMPADLPRADGIGLNATVLAFSFGLCVLTGTAFGLGLASQIARTGVNHVRGMLIAVQFALAIVLLTGAGLLIRSFSLLNAVRPGFDVARLLTMTVALPTPLDGDAALRRIEALPGVRGAAAGIAISGSLRDHVPNQTIVVEGRPATQDLERHEASGVSDGYFRIMGIPLLAGRLFSSEDRPEGPGVAVINETMARRYWPSQSAIGKRFKQVLPGLDSPWLTVVGVAGDVIHNRDGGPAPVFYVPIRQWPRNETPLIVRTDVEPLSLVAAVRQAARSVDPGIPWFDISTAELELAKLDRPRRFQTELLTAFAFVAVLLAAVGLYGLMSYTVGQRAKEIGIRVALGATSANIVGLVLRNGLAWAVTGAVIGIAGAMWLASALSAMLFGIAANDPLTLAAVVAALAIVMGAAACLPTRRAIAVDPAITLRHE